MSLHQGIEYILECLHHADFQLRSNALNAAAAVCEDPASRAIMFENKFLPAVMEMLHDADNELCAAVAKVLRAITDGNAENAVMAFELGVVSQVCTTLLRRARHAVIGEHLSAVLVVLRRHHTERFDRDLRACRGLRAMLQLLRADQARVWAAEDGRDQGISQSHRKSQKYFCSTITIRFLNLFAILASLTAICLLALDMFACA